MKKIITSELLPMLHHHFYLAGREHKKIVIARRIILLLFALTSLLTAQSKSGNTSIFNSNWISLGLQNEGISNIAVDWSDPDIIYVSVHGAFPGNFNQNKEDDFS